MSPKEKFAILMHIRQFIILTLSIFILSACSTPPTSQPIGVTATALHATPVSQNKVLVDGWRGIPMAPGAFKGWAESDSWQYQTYSSIDEVTSFYIKEYESKGWTLAQYETNVSFGYKPGGNVLHFENADHEVIRIHVCGFDDNSTFVYWHGIEREVDCL